MTNAKERIHFVLAQQNMRPTTFEKACGLSEARIRNIYNGKVTTISDEVASAICILCPDIDRTWLQTGIGTWNGKAEKTQEEKESELVTILREKAETYKDLWEDAKDQLDRKEAELAELRKLLDDERRTHDRYVNNTTRIQQQYLDQLTNMATGNTYLATPSSSSNTPSSHGPIGVAEYKHPDIK